MSTRIHNSTFYGGNRSHRYYEGKQQQQPRHSDEEDARKLNAAIVRDDKRTLQRLLHHGANPNSWDRAGHAPLFVAAMYEDREWMIKELLYHRADPNARCFTDHDKTPVHQACIHGHVDNLRVLLEYGGSLSQLSSEMCNAEDYAKKCGFGEVAKFFSLLEIQRARDGHRLYNSSASRSRSSSLTRAGLNISKLSNGTEYFSCANSPDMFNKCLPRSHESSRSRESSTAGYDEKFDNNDDRYIRDDDSGIYRGRSESRKRSSSRHNQKKSLSRDRCVPSSSSESDWSETEPRHSRGRVGFHIPRKDNKPAGSSTFYNNFNPAQDRNVLKNFNINEQKWTAAAPPVKPPRRSRDSTSRILPDLTQYTVVADNMPDDLTDMSRYAGMTDKDLIGQLKSFGEEPGPILSDNRVYYIRRLIRLQHERKHSNEVKISVSYSDHTSMTFCKELVSVINGSYDEEKMEMLKKKFSTAFDQVPDQKKKKSIYLLVDPQITGNLSEQLRQSTDANLELCFKKFLRAVFYIGKAGTSDRPNEHLIEARYAYNANKVKMNSQKAVRICSIWENGHGVVCARCFGSRCDDEASTREALMIEALGKEKLTNQIHGSIRGDVKKWMGSDRRLLGSYFLSKAFNILLHDGEMQLFPEDV